MGVSGSGKSTVGCRVAEELSLTFIEADDFHPQHNVQKMAGGAPLTDEDRGPWVEALVAGINARQPQRDALVACSALTKFVRDRLRAGVKERVHFILLSADPTIIQQRLVGRKRHFMHPRLLSSQLAALEWPSDAVVIDASRPLDVVCADVASCIRREQDR
ncbi:MAG TPA: gluconokinase [Steroidobacteraceae bacterium]|nr:gluconokinase [Steroidobacteraceae bacterium]